MIQPSHFRPRSQLRKGFTLVELLLVVGIIAILMFVTISSINPGKNLAAARNAQRRQDVNTIINAIYQYSLDKDTFPPSIPIGTIPKQICKTQYFGTQCNNGVNLRALSGVYIGTIPVDPQASPTGTGTSYWIVRDSTTNKRITVSAPNAENNEVIYMMR